FPALDRIVEVVRFEASDLDQLAKRRLDVAGLVDAPRLEDGFAAVPPPVDSEACVGEAKHGRLPLRLAPSPSGVGGDFHAADEPTPRPRQPGDLVEAWSREPLAARGEGDHRLRLHDDLELSGLAVRH